MQWPLFDRIPKETELQSTESGSDLILDRFLDYVSEQNLELYAAQEEAILELFSEKNVILNTPTGSGKSLVALALHFDSLTRGRRSYYTSPIKALVNEKFFALCRAFGPEQVGMITGDATVNANAKIICCTAEILMNDALRLGESAPIQDIIMDEFHYYSDRERGVAWQIPLLCLPNARFLLISATMGDTTPFELALTQLNGLKTVVVSSTERPVPLDFQYSEYPLHEAVSKLIHAGRAPIYLVNFTQRECAEEAQNFLSVDLCTKEEKKRIAENLVGFKFSSPYGKELQKILKHGMGIHHASLLPKYRNLVEKLAQKGLLKIIFGTDTLGVGVNVPIRTVLLTKLCKFDGQKTVLLSVRDFHQIAGRAGRKGFDDLGTVVIQAPAHLIENIRNEQKAAQDPKKLKKLVKQKPPEKGYLPWSKETLDRLVAARPENLVSRFKINHAMILQILSRPSPQKSGHPIGCIALRTLIRDCHESESTKKKLRKTAFELFRSLVDRKIIELNPLRVHVDLQEDFSLNHALSLYLIDTLKLIADSEQFALNALTLVESILEDPELILRKQLDRIKSIKMIELKAEGLDFDQRIEELEKLEYPKPNRDFIYSSFNIFAAAHPWVGQNNISPKSIAREMIENFYSFEEYIREYDLERAEGLLLRYISDVYKALVQNIPTAYQTPELEEIILYFGAQLKQIDSSLIDDWEKMKTPLAGLTENLVAPLDPPLTSNAIQTPNITVQKKAFLILCRNAVFRIVKLLATEKFDPLLELVSQFDLESIKTGIKAYKEAGHSKICFDQNARNPNHFRVIEGAERASQFWVLEQTLVDSEGLNDWAIRLTVDLEQSKVEQLPVLIQLTIGPL